MHLVDLWLGKSNSEGSAGHDRIHNQHDRSEVFSQIEQPKIMQNRKKLTVSFLDSTERLSSRSLVTLRLWLLG